MLVMILTLEVSKLSGWLKAYAACRESKGGQAYGAGHAACRGGLVCRLGAGHGEERTTNIWSMVVTLEVSKLSGWLNAFAFCRESKGGAYNAGQGSGREAGGGG